ncbi:MAG: acyl-ACP--UDP-N-acetylglucosamine O-acyltransferase [Deltaproteobacteria bacterium]|nr:acyl-ACP--UDP-N-acetylglucosamine O-acyltransferase [Deltaproteobacteria bacterium]
MAVDPSAQIHPTAIVAEGASIGAETSVGAYSIIDAEVVIGCRNRIGPHVVITGRTQIGDENEIFQFASVGAVPQDLKYHGEPSRLEIGNRNKIREYVTLQPGTEGGGMLTSIGNNNLFMACTHVGHDGKVGNYNVFANGAGLSGHVEVGNHVVVGGMAGIHQFVRLGDYGMLAAGAMVGKDVPPYCIAQGDHAELVGLNQIGLQRAGWSSEDLGLMRKLFRQVLCGEGLFKQRVMAARAQYQGHAAAEFFLDFLLSSERGIMPARRRSGEESE